MAGKGCTGAKRNNAGNAKLSRAYCEGRQASFDGALIGTNPHLAGSEAADVWDAGHASYVTGGLTPGPKDCCSIAPLAA